MTLDLFTDRKGLCGSLAGKALLPCCPAALLPCCPAALLPGVSLSQPDHGGWQEGRDRRAPGRAEGGLAEVRRELAKAKAELAACFPARAKAPS
jgi:hypothetical protein